jgi:hypothetical protein
MTKLRFLDSLTPFPNRAEEMHSIRQNPKEGRWLHPTRDAAMKRVYFSSIGMFFTKKAPGFEQGYVADLLKATFPNTRCAKDPI